MKRSALAALAASALTALVLVASGAGGIGSLGSYFFGPKLVRAEVLLKDATGMHDYRVDRGRIRQVRPDSLTLLERDGTLVTIPVAAGADVRLGGIAVPLTSLRRGFVATTVREGDAPAQTVLAAR
jgi:hypothetical protein